jgi:hypothetical protein
VPRASERGPSSGGEAHIGPIASRLRRLLACPVSLRRPHDFPVARVLRLAFSWLVSRPHVAPARAGLENDGCPRGACRSGSGHAEAEPSPRG